MVSASGKGKPGYASSHLLNRMTAMLRTPAATRATRQRCKRAARRGERAAQPLAEPRVRA
jgi:hypothetical protein